MAVTKNITFLTYLSDFWLTYYQDAPLLDYTLGAHAEVLKSLYFRFLQKSVPWAVQDMPVFQEQFWNVIELFADEAEYISQDGEFFFKYPLDEAYAHIPYLYNVVYDPSVRLKEYQDYIFKVELSTEDINDYPFRSTSYILFKEKPNSFSNPFNGDPFTNNDIAKRIVDGNRVSITLFAPKVFIDSNDLYREWGILVDIPAVSSEQYRDFLQGMFYLFIKGPSIAALNSGLNVAAGYPSARQTEIIRTCEIAVDPDIEQNEFILTSDQGNTYVIPRKIVQELDPITSQILTFVFPRLAFSSKTYFDGINNVFVNNPDFSDPLLPVGEYNIYFEVGRFDTFLSDLRIVDSSTEPNWWRSQLGTLSTQMAPGLTDVQRRDPAVQDFLFNRYFKSNTFGVFVDIRVFRADFQLVDEFFNIINKVKPTYKSYIVYQNDLQILTFVSAGNTYTDPKELDVNGNFTPNFSDGVLFNYTMGYETVVGTYPTIGMGLPYEENSYQYGAIPVTIGMAIEDIGSAYDLPAFDLRYPAGDDYGFRTTYNIGNGWPIIVGMSDGIDDLEIGILGNEYTTEYTTLMLTEAPVMNSLSYSGSGPYTMPVSWSSVIDADEYVVLYDGNEWLYTTNTSEVLTGIPDETKSFSVIALFDGFLSRESNQLFIPIGPILTMSNVSYTTLDLDWTPILGALNYLVDFSVSPTFSSFILQDFVVGGISHSLTGLTFGTTYYARVRADLGSGILTQFSNIEIDTTLPFDPPVALSASDVTETGFKANWTSVPIATFYYLDVYDNLLTPVVGFTNLIVFGTDQIVTGLTEGVLYKYVVRSGDGVNTSIDSNEISVMTGDYAFLRTFTPLSGVIVPDDSITPVNPGIINTQTEEPFTFIREFPEGSGTTLGDVTSNTNDGTLITDPPPDPYADIVILREFPEGSGTTLGDVTSNTNDGAINPATPPDPTAPYVLLFEYAEGSGFTLNDSTANNNDGDILP